jgi:hypothetical protein
MLKGILSNILGSPVTSILGGIAGVPQMFEGYTTHNTMKLMEGLGLFLLGLATKH